MLDQLTFVFSVQMENIGKMCSVYKWDQREKEAASLKINHKKIEFAELHFHIDKIKAIVGPSTLQLQSILNNGPMPQTIVCLQHVVCDFFHGFPQVGKK